MVRLDGTVHAGLKNITLEVQCLKGLIMAASYNEVGNQREQRLINYIIHQSTILPTLQNERSTIIPLFSRAQRYYISLDQYFQ